MGTMTKVNIRHEFIDFHAMKDYNYYNYVKL